MKKNNFGKCTQEATRKELAKELRVNKSQISLLESSFMEVDQKIHSPLRCIRGPSRSRFPSELRRCRCSVTAR